MQPVTNRKAWIAALIWLIGTSVQGWLADGEINVGEILLAIAGTPLAGYAVWRTPYYGKPKPPPLLARPE